MEPTREELIASLAERVARFAAREAELIAQRDNALRVAEQAGRVFNAIKILRAGNHLSVEPHAIADCMQTDLAQHLDDWQRLMSCPSAKTLCGLIMQLNLEVALMTTEPTHF